MTALTLAAPAVSSLPISRADGWLLRRFEWSPAPVRPVVSAAVDDHGELDTSTLHGAATVTMALRVPSAPFESKIRQLRAFARADLRPTLTVDYEDGSSPLVAKLSRLVVTSAIEAATHRDVVVQAVCPSGIMESAELHTDTIIPGAGGVDGVEFASTLEFGPTLEFPFIDPPGTRPVTNAGDRDASPVLRAFGPFGDEGNVADQTEIGNVTTGRSLVFAGLGIAAGDYLEIDVRNRTILVNGVTTQSRYQYLSFPDSAWWTLSPGVNEVSFRPDTFSGNAQMQVFWRDAWA